MRSLLTVPLMAFFLSFDLHALEVTTRVHEIDVSTLPPEPSLVFLSTGQVGKVVPGSELFEAVDRARHSGDWLRVSLNDEREIVRAEIIVPPMEVEKPFTMKSALLSEAPTVLGSMVAARRFFNEAKYKDKESQCFNRAHVWSYEWKKKHRIDTSKIFLFFTARYIREFDFGWWFHLAPMVHVAIGPDVKERVMDRKYLKGPSSIQKWIENFMEKGTKCRTVKAFSEYANYPEAGDCFLMRTSMYTYWPLDLELEELYGNKKTGWVQEEIRQAYLEALDITI